MSANEIIFLVTDLPDGGYTAKALGESIYTEADSLGELRGMVQDAVRCHIGENAQSIIFLLQSSD